MEKKKDMGDIFSDLQHDIDSRNQALRARAKPYDSLMIALDCTVIEANGYTKGTSFTPRSEVVIGGRSSSYSGGDHSHLELAVESDSPIKHLLFQGLPPIEKGDRIRAYVFKGEEKHEEAVFSLRRCGEPSPPKHYVERDLVEKERALKIEKLRSGIIVATYHN